MPRCTWSNSELEVSGSESNVGTELKTPRGYPALYALRDALLPVENNSSEGEEPLPAEHDIKNMDQENLDEVNSNVPKEVAAAIKSFVTPEDLVREGYFVVKNEHPRRSEVYHFGVVLSSKIRPKRLWCCQSEAQCRND